MVHKSSVQPIAAANKRADVKATAAPAACTLYYSGRSILLIGSDDMDEPAVVAAVPPLRTSTCVFHGRWLCPCEGGVGVITNAPRRDFAR